MKWLLSLFLCWSASAQLPIFSYKSSGANYCNFDFANGVSGASNYARFIGYSSTNFGALGAGTQVTWTNLVPWGATATTIMIENSSGNLAIVTNTGPSSGLYCVDFTADGYTGNDFMSCARADGTKIDGSNQPVTIFIVATDVGHNVNGSVLLDANIGAAARQKYDIATIGGGR